MHENNKLEKPKLDFDFQCLYHILKKYSSGKQLGLPS